jgi:hypothetical protein
LKPLKTPRQSPKVTLTPFWKEITNRLEELDWPDWPQLFRGGNHLDIGYVAAARPDWQTVKSSMFCEQLPRAKS